MRSIYPNSCFRMGTKLYRKLFYRKGFGVHSPFVFNLITKVIGERNPYYAYALAEGVRSRLLARRDPVLWSRNPAYSPARIHTLAEITGREAVSPACGALLFRLANYFKSKYILQVGAGAGISTLYLTAYASDVQATVLESDPVLAAIAREAVGRTSAYPVRFLTGPYREMLSGALQEMPQVDFVFFHTAREGAESSRALFCEAVRFVHAGTVFVIDGIRAGRSMKAFWKEACAHPAATVTVDLYSLGLIFFDPKLYKRNYIVYF